MGSTLRHPALFAVLAPGAALLVAYGYFESALNLEPCTLCWWQRYAHMAALGAGVVALGLVLIKSSSVQETGGGRLFAGALLVAIGALGTAAGLALWHLLTELGVIPLLVCQTPSLDLESGDAFAQILERQPVRCDRAPWAFLGISIAGWNFIYSLGATAILSFLMYRAYRKPPATEGETQ